MISSNPLLCPEGQVLLKFAKGSSTAYKNVAKWLDRRNDPAARWNGRAELISSLCSQYAKYKGDTFPRYYTPFKDEKRRIVLFLALMEHFTPSTVVALHKFAPARSKFEELGLTPKTEPERQPTMNTKLRNAAILTDESIHTVWVVFPNDSKEYAYLAHRGWGVKEGDKLLVPQYGATKTHAFTVVDVVAVDEEADIDIDSDTVYRFCYGVYLTHRDRAEEKLQETADKVKKVRSKQARQQMRDSLMSELLLESK